MLEKAQQIISEYEETLKQLANPEITKDLEKLKNLSIVQKNLADSYEKAKQYKKLANDVKETKGLLTKEENPENKKFYSDYLEESRNQLNKLAQDLASDISAGDDNDKRNIIMEIRAGTGGEEAALFAADLYRMYLRFAEKKGWHVEQLSSNRNESGGFKEVIFSLKGSNVYGALKYENGVHRVQRVPATESSGRIHTSAASVVVLPEVSDIEITVNPDDLRIDVYRSSGPGGQSVNTTDSAVRITHIHTGIVVSCQDEKSQLKNKQRALAILKSRLYDRELEKKQETASQQRQASIRGGDRSVKIKTYNYPQNRLTDHRLHETWYNLENILNGNLEEILATTGEKFKEQK